jgi:hypothetical protein
MKTLFRIRFFGPQSDNRKSKIKNRKLAGILAVVVTIALSGVVAQAQQPGKIYRIGFLDRSTASGNVVLLDVLRQELSKLGWVEGKKSSSSLGLLIKKPSAYPILRPNWCV